MFSRAVAEGLGRREPEESAHVHILMLGDSFLEGLKVEEDQTIPVVTHAY
ncbi:MAG: hypothetical protein V3V49_02315 [Candidatus Krumholzibacteria bacterium]